MTLLAEVTYLSVVDTEFGDTVTKGMYSVVGDLLKILFRRSVASKKLFRRRMNYINVNHRDNHLSLYLVEVDLTVVGLKVAAVLLME